jgi:hypothetical protein
MISEEDFEIGNAPYREIAKQDYKDYLLEILKDQKLAGISASDKERIADKEAETWRDDFIEYGEGKFANGMGHNGSWSVRTRRLAEEYIKIRDFLKIRRLLPYEKSLKKNFALMKQKKKSGQSYSTETLEVLDALQGVKTIMSEDDPEVVMKTYLNKIVAEEVSHSLGYLHGSDDRQKDGFFLDFANLATRYNTIDLE